ncbi:MAG: ATP-dependent DNA helicase PcrA [Bacteroidetes bacterium]|nr:MAG: ATP-dependent DNA helicase PcrA [Bacteroidota bacterium]
MTQLIFKPDSRSAPAGIDPDKILAGLNEAQQEAASLTDGPVLIIAGPGSGKTRTLTHRIAYLLATGRAKPWEILAITFTNKAAREMQSRVAGLLGDEVTQGMWIGTFHSTFARVLRRECHHIGFTSDFTIYDSDDSQRIVKEVMQSHNINTSDIRPKAIANLISGAKNRMVSPTEFAATVASPLQEYASTVYQPYVDRLRQANAMDFDDLLLKPLELFRNHVDVLSRYHDRWKYVHVDEYQDTNRAQYLLAKTLAERNQNLCVVGDDAQSIYAFRGADISNILSFQKDYPDAASVRLEQNYRSTKHIVKLADSIIRNNRKQLEKKLWTNNPAGDPVIVVEAISERDEAQKIERKVRDIQVRLGLMYKDFAVLYRTNAQSRSIEDALRRGNIPYRVIGGMSFYQRKEIKDALAYLRLVVNPNDIASLRRVINYPTRGIGDKSQNQLFAYARREGLGVWEALERVNDSGVGPRAAAAISTFRDTLSGYREQLETESAQDLAKTIIRDSGLLEDLRKEHTPENLVRWENIQELLSAISEFVSADSESQTLSAFLQEITLVTDADMGPQTDNHVTLMTLHASKGLEFPVVFLAGMEEGLFPLSGASQDPADLEEERRLFYVGATRAERLLILLYARSRFRYGEQQSAVRSRFLEEIDPDVVRTEAGLKFEPRSGRFSSVSGSSISYEKMDPHYYRKSLVPKKPQPETDYSQVPSAVKITSPVRTGRTVVYDEEESGGITSGMNVEHVQFGEGKVLSVEGNGEQARVVVFFQSVGRKKLIMKFARLRRIE